MTLFEYVTVAVSIVLALGLMRLLDGLRVAVLRRRRYLVHVLWIVNRLVVHLVFWWGLWAGRDTISWNFASFVWILVFPGTLYIQSTILVTSDPGGIPSWREHFYEVRKPFFWLNVLLIFQALVSSMAFPATEVNRILITRLPLVFAMLISLLAIASPHPRLHLAIAVTMLALQLFGFGTIWFQPFAASAG